MLMLYVNEVACLSK